ncbi:amidophosphoribosyltransferase [Candidatus Kaiserbacteria bacterium RIFCSPHIGHO2_01_FULL_48_10]|uniref:Amidophosphoribosyltransferase n=1 Tax=Candidatus Kaiserbacteria bacterium RIFCSPHIGHO2_01_FULL_48_10 TaxID=1798476 RepID=A0A1F6C4P5_9BACT|nr:MAG: amidophosphoribosyltransferase [Candidatus Kaiserbacteria bacterium RIFCSPHIGHO2_01_FULL_48_10]
MKDRELGEKCGVFGVFGTNLDAARLTFFGLYALQHRGQESSGIATSDGTTIHLHRKMGLVAQVFSEKTIQELAGSMAIGHNRYSTSQSSSVKHAQPAIIEDVQVVLAHNGNLPSTKALEAFIAEHKIPIRKPSDSEMIVEAIGFYVRNGKSLPDAVEATYPLMTGAFSILVMDKENLIAIRDSHGIRPLSIGTINGGYVFSSETCAFHPIGAEYLRDVEPGEMVVVNKNGIQTKKIAEGIQNLDIFEFVYFARPDSRLLGKSVYGFRKNCGIELGKEFPVEADVIIPVPETAIPVALGYSAQTKIPMEMGLIKNRYIHRTFIQPEQHIREQGVKIKLTPLPEVIKGKRVVVVDDSIVRGTTSKQIVAMLFEAGATEVNFMVSSPPVKFPDFYGIDTPLQKDLIAAERTEEEILKYLGATRLHYLSFDGMMRATELPKNLFSTSCFTGEYPIDILERKAEIKDLTMKRMF